SINWGDGTASTGTVSGGNGSFLVSGNHTYTGTGQKTVAVTLTDDAPGTASAMANSTANVTIGAAHPVADFNGDGKSEILWRDAGGNVAIWGMDGTTVTSSGVAGFADPGNWHIVGTGDFNGDGKSDILWRDAGGNVAIWGMNGTTVTSSGLAGF